MNSDWLIHRREQWIAAYEAARPFQPTRQCSPIPDSPPFISRLHWPLGRVVEITCCHHMLDSLVVHHGCSTNRPDGQEQEVVTMYYVYQAGTIRTSERL
jgi:hypothetical protein